MPKLKKCECWKCKHNWKDYTGVFAKITPPKYMYGPEGCPECHSLYWTETDDLFM